ncbi:hypothetical protein TWF481_011783 [Arthrobotrys musiformis]|uniref:AB hydrolase-1 domain-containing protein n=1 Tax=Arthrobotrys musiformis TaxID=47236 RepID=A0AAV9VV97_9PEZI
MMSSPTSDNNTQQHKHHQREYHPRQHHHHHHHHHHSRNQHHHHHHQAQKTSSSAIEINKTCNRGNSSDDCEEDALLDNLPRDDVPSILSLSISRSQSTYQNAALSGAHPPLPSPSANLENKEDSLIKDDPSPPKKTFFASQGKSGGLGVLTQTKLFRPRASSLGNADHASKEHGDHDKWVSKLPSFSLPSLQLPQLPSFGSNSKDGMDREKGAPRSKRAGSLLIDSLAKAAAGVSNHFTTNGPTHASNSTCSAPAPRKLQPNLHAVNSLPNTNATQDFAPISNPEATAGSKFDLAPTNGGSLRRSNSDSSSVRRALSRTSSIGSDTRFLDVREQTNARYKAIKDSILPDIKDSFTFNTPALVKKATSGNLAAAAAAATHPLDKLSGDVVIMGGYRGSILKKVKTSPTGQKRIGRTLWIPVKVGFNLQSVDLEVPFDPEAELLMEEKVVATDMLSHLAGVDISRRLIKRLRANPNVRLHVFAYDWRLSPHLNSEKLVLFMANLPCNRASKLEQSGSIGDLWHEDGPFVIAHSLGGLITRHAINRRPDLFKCGGVLYAGVPQRCVNVLGPLRNGDSVAFNKDVLNAQVNFSFRSSFVFLPEDGQVFMDRKTGNLLDFDLYDPAMWQQYNLSPCVSPTNKPAPTGLLSTASGAMATVLREGKDVRDKLSRWTPSSPGLLSDGFPKKQPTRDDGAVQLEGNLVPDTSDAFVSEQRGNEVQEIAATGAGAAAPTMTTSAAANPQSSCTLPLSVTIPYLERTLRETKKFRSELAFQPTLAEQYPPFAVLYSKTTPTVKAARVNGLEGLKTSNYSDLIFGAGDGVVLSREAMLPEGYTCEKRVHCDRGHISLLGDLDAVGQCIEALLEARERNKRRLLRTLGRSTPSSA